MPFWVCCWSLLCIEQDRIVLLRCRSEREEKRKESGKNCERMSSVPGAFARHVKCPCCNNPWNVGSDSSGVESLPICAPCLTDSKGYSGIDPENFDPTVSPAENFFLWSNGGWKAKNPIPQEYSSWNTFLVLRDRNLERLKAILDELDNVDPTSCPISEDEMFKLKNYYQAFMNESRIESNGLQSLQSAFELVGQVQLDPTRVIAKLHLQFGVNVFFSVYSTPDKAQSEHTLASLYQGGLGMPDRDYYFDEDKHEKRMAYLNYIQQLLSLAGQYGLCAQVFESASKVEEISRQILDFETHLARTHLTRTESRDPQRTYNKMSVNALIALCARSSAVDWSSYLARGVPQSPFDWNLYFDIIGRPVHSLGDINVSAVQAVTRFHNLLLPQHAHVLPFYLIFHVLNSFAPHLPNAFVMSHFQFHEKDLKGTNEIQPRWKRALQGLESALGEALGKLYVAKHFAGDAKARALDVVESVRDALRERLHEVKWMSDSSRVEALKKMEKFKVKIGYPDEWKDYSLLAVQADNHVQNVLASRQFDFAVDLGRMNAPTDKKRWFMTPQTVNAYYHPSLNEIVFPAAILQAPFFDPEADLAVQFGSLGAVVGHEMTHGFDDQGRKYDSNGNLRDWWAPGDGEEYERRAGVMIRQAEAFEVFGLKLNGKLTCGENIADLGGVKLALRALQKKLSAEASAQLINGFTPLQRFFLAWSQSWRENVKKERAIQLVTLDPHGPNELRCNGTLSNVPEFFEAFNIHESQKMYRAEQDRVDIW